MLKHITLSAICHLVASQTYDPIIFPPGMEDSLKQNMGPKLQAAFDKMKTPATCDQIDLCDKCRFFGCTWDSKKCNGAAPLKPDTLDVIQVVTLSM